VSIRVHLPAYASQWQAGPWFFRTQVLKISFSNIVDTLIKNVTVSMLMAYGASDLLTKMRV